MRRAIIATVGTAVGLVALLQYKSDRPLQGSRVALHPSSSGSPAGNSSAGSSGSTAMTGHSPGGGAADGTSQQFTGTDVVYKYGDIQLQATITGGKIAVISVSRESDRDAHSQSINSQAIPILTREALAAQGISFNVVSGATYTSDAFAQALQSALAKGGK